MGTIEFLIKFFSKEKYSDDLMSGKLYMNAAGFYHRLEKGQGDQYEASITPGGEVKKNDCRPIYCMYAVKRKDVVNGRVLIPGKILDDFDCRNGWAVVISFACFEGLLRSSDGGGVALKGGLVQYSDICSEDTFGFLKDDEDLHLLLKRPGFAYQNEFRLVCGVALPLNDKGEYEHYERQLPRSLDSLAKKISISDFLDNGDFVLPLSEISRLGCSVND